MNSLNPIDGCEAYNQPPTEQGLINQILPLELFEGILNYLNFNELQPPSRVNRLWNEVSINIAKRREFTPIKDFEQFLIEDLPMFIKDLPKELHASLIKKVFEIKGNKKNWVYVSLSEVKLLKENILNALKVLDAEDLKSLTDLCKRKSMPEFFEKACYSTRIDKANAITDRFGRFKAFFVLVEEFTLAGNMDEALKIAVMMPDERDPAFLMIAKVFATNGNLVRAVEIAGMISEKSLRDRLESYFIEN